MKKISYVLVLVVSCLVPLSTVFATIAVRPLFLYFSAGGAPYQDLVVINQGKKTSYIQISPRIVENNGMKNQKVTTEKKPKKLGFIVTPLKFKLSGKQARNVRVGLIKKPGEKDRVYQLLVEPKLGKIKMKKTSKHEAFLRISTAYLIDVEVLPKHPKPNLKITRKGKEVTITNNGNVTLLLSKGSQCKAGGDGCKLLKPIYRKRHLYPNNVWKFKVPGNGPIRYETAMGGEGYKVFTST